MSSRERDNTGIILPSIDEASEIELTVMGDKPVDSYIFEVGAKVMGSSRRLRREVRSSARYSLLHDYERVGLRERKDFKKGVRYGYELFAGYVTLAGFFRGRYESIEQYLETIKGDPLAMPLTTKTQAKRVKGFRTGKEPIDIIHSDYFFDNSSEIAHLEFGDYMTEAVVLDSIVNRVRWSLDPLMVDENEGSMLVEGFDHGCANALEMYVQSREVAILAALDFDP